MLDGYVTDHIAIIKDQSSLYRQLAIFETDGERKCKMHRRRAGYCPGPPGAFTRPQRSRPYISSVTL